MKYLKINCHSERPPAGRAGRRALRMTIIIYLLSAYYSFAQENQLKFQRISVKQGMSVTTVFSIIQDDNDFLWAATFDGLHRYDGYEFIIYKNKYGDTLSLSENTLSALYKSKNGTIWIGTYNGGLHKFNTQTGKFNRFQNIPDNPNSLSNNGVWAICEDNHGMLWIGTEVGLNKYDPVTNKFTRYFHEEDNINSLSNSRILTIKKDKSGALWIGTVDGLNKYVPQKNEDLPSQAIALAGEGVPSQAIALAGEGLPPVFIHYKYIPDDPNSLSHNIVLSIFEDRKGIMWIGTIDGLNKFSPMKDIPNFTVYRFNPDSTYFALHTEAKTKTIQSYSYLNHYGHNAIRDIFEDDEGKLWLATDKGLKILNLQTDVFANYQNDPANPNSISDDILYCLYPDKSRNLWIGTIAGGMNKIDMKPKKFFLYQREFGNPYNLSTNNIRSIYEDSKGALWVGTMGGGLNRIDLQSGKFYRFQRNLDNSDSSFDPDNVWVIYEDRKGFIWLGTSKGLYQYNADSDEFKHFEHNPNDPGSISDNIIRSVFHDSKGFLWVGTERGLNKFDYKSEKFIHFIKSDDDANSLGHNSVWIIREHPDGIIWIGTDDGLDKLVLGENNVDTPNERSRIFTHYKNDPKNKNSISHNSIRTIYVDAKGILWFGTNNGLNKFIPETESFIRYNVEDGLPNPLIYAILEDDEGNLWMSTNKGISRFTPPTHQPPTANAQKSGREIKVSPLQGEGRGGAGVFKNYDIHDGLQNNEFNRGAYYKNKNGEMFFGGPGGLNRFHPDRIIDNPNIPAVVITSIKILGIEIDKNIETHEINELNVHYNENVLAFEFASLDFTLPEKNQYAYMLEGFDKTWTHTKTRRYVNYTNLDPGEYTFKVIASNNDDTWNFEGTQLHITIIPPFWKTWWFYLLVIVVVAGSIYIYIKRLQQEKNRLEREVRKRTKEVVKQKQIIEKKNENITDSIKYAKHIQDAILPSKEYMDKALGNYFVLNKPRDIVSGDFYWIYQAPGRKVIVAATDCTGHGVPGAFMSMMGNALLNQIIIEKGISDPAEVLNQMQEGVVTALQTDEESSMSDGMDMALISLKAHPRPRVLGKSQSAGKAPPLGEDLGGAVTLQYAGAYNPLYIVRKVIPSEAGNPPDNATTLSGEPLASNYKSAGGSSFRSASLGMTLEEKGVRNNYELTDIKANKQPVGYYEGKQTPFTKHEIQLQKGDTIYIFSDGYQDQIGGPENKKFMEERLKELLVSIQHLNMNEQKEKLNNEIENWRGNSQQTDDIMIIGIKF